MRVLLIHPSQRKAYGFPLKGTYPPLGLLYVSSVIENQGHEVRFVDEDIRKKGRGTFREYVKAYRPELVGITATSPEVGSAMEIARLIKKHSPETLIILGGAHASAAPEQVLETGCFDGAVIGEGEKTIEEFVQFLEKNQSIPLDLKGFATLDRDKRIVRGGTRTLIDELDTLPFPSRHILGKLSYYIPPDAEDFPVMNIMASRGCPGKCTFCASSRSFGRKVRYRSVRNVADEIEQGIVKWKVREIHFADDCLTEDPGWIMEFCREIEKRKKYLKKELNFMFMNGLSIEKVSREMLEALVCIGLKNVGFGIESGDENILKRLNKPIDLVRAEQIIEYSKKLGLTVWLFFLIGSPGESDKSMATTLEFALRTDPDFAKFLLLKPFPGTEVRKELENENLLIDKNPEHLGIYTFPVHRTKEMSSQRMVYWQKRTNLKFYLRPVKILKHMSKIRSMARLRSNLKSLNFIFQMIMGRIRE